ncbi:MAG: response regulator [Eubacterium sp.]|nr:response regulator [Eubacterium sp.]
MNSRKNNGKRYRPIVQVLIILIFLASGIMLGYILKSYAGDKISPERVCDALIFFLGAFFWILHIIRKISKSGSRGMEYISVACIVMALYFFLENDIVRLYKGNELTTTAVIALVNIIVSAFVTIYYYNKFSKVFRYGFLIPAVIEIINAIIYTLIYIFEFVPMWIAADFSRIILVITLMIMGIKIILNARSKKELNYRYTMVMDISGILIFAYTTMSDVINNISLSPSGFNALSRYGATFYVLMSFLGHIREIIIENRGLESENERLLQQTIDNERRLLEEARSEKEKAEADNVAKSLFLANMSHEIRTPINAILGMNTMIRREAVSPEVKEYADNVDTAAHSLLSLINDILDFSKIESGKMDIVPTKYKLYDLIKEVYIMAKERAGNKDIKLELINDPNLPTELYGDEVRIREILMNLLSNAIKYTKEGTVTLRLSMLEIRNPDIWFMIEVEDTGSGIKPENINRIFDSFKRVDEKKNKNIEGTGLGLNITKNIVEMMGGNISVTSEYEVGSVFKVEIPQTVVSSKKVGNIAAKMEAENNELKRVSDIYRSKVFAPKARVLVVDDVEMNIRVFKALLKNSGMQIDSATKGVEAVELISENHYDIIFLDDMMPEMDGKDVLSKIKKLSRDENFINKDTTVVMLTANAVAGARENYLSMGFDEYLSKPIQDSELEDLIIRLLPSDKTENTRVLYEAEEKHRKDAAAKSKITEILNEDTEVLIREYHKDKNEIEKTEEPHKKKRNLRLIFYGVGYSFLGLILLIFLISNYGKPYTKFGLENDSYIIMTDGWKITSNNQTIKNAQIPNKLQEINADKDVVISNVIPETVKSGNREDDRIDILSDPDAYQLFIYSKGQDIKVLLDGEEIYNYQYKEKSLFNKNFAPNIWIPVNVPRDAAGKTIEIHYHMTRNENSKVSRVIYGDRLSIAKMMIKDNMFLILSLFVMIVMAIGCIVYYLANNLKKEDGKGFVYIAITMFFVSVWCLVQCDVRQLVFKNVLVARDMEFFTLMLLPIPLLKSVTEVIHNKYKKIVDVVAFGSIITNAIIVSLAITGHGTLRNYLVLTDLVIMLAMLTPIYIFIKIYFSDRKMFKKLKSLVLIHAITYLCGILEIVSALFLGDKFEGNFLAAGAVIYGIGIFIEMINRQKVTVIEKQKIEIQDRIKSNYLANVAGQIRTPLNALLTMDEMILSETRESGIAGYAEEIRVQGLKLTKIINSIIEYSRVKGGINAFEESTYDSSVSQKEKLKGIIFDEEKLKGFTSILLDRKDKTENVEEDVPVIKSGEPSDILNKGFDVDTVMNNLAKSEDFDVEKGLRYCADDKEFFIEVIKRYIYENNFDKIEGLFKDKDWENYRIAVHALKGTFYTIGADEMGDKAKEMESFVKEGNIEAVEKNHEKMMEDFNSFIDRVREYTGLTK